jgi:hypothetical protein
MKQMERKIEITYRWWRTDKKTIKTAHVEALEEAAMDRIKKMMGEDYTSGELCDNIHMTDDDPEDGVGYSGWWEVKQSDSIRPHNNTRRDRKMKTTKKIKTRLEYLRREIKAERISTGEVLELQSLAEHIEQDDVLLLEWAGVPESFTKQSE